MNGAGRPIYNPLIIDTSDLELLPQVSKTHILEKVGWKAPKNWIYHKQHLEGERFGIVQKHANPRRTRMVQVITHES